MNKDEGSCRSVCLDAVQWLNDQAMQRGDLRYASCGRRRRRSLKVAVIADAEMARLRGKETQFQKQEIERGRVNRKRPSRETTAFYVCLQSCG
jgi:hypothetical protein